MADIPRGVRNNNPGNIRRVRGQHWLGESPEQTDPAFVQFVSPEYGIRALATVLLTYQRRHKLRTIDDIIARWAPPTENDTDAYVRAVERYTGVARDEPLDLRQHDLMCSLVEAIIAHECAGHRYPPDVVSRGVWAALVARAGAADDPLRRPTIRETIRTDTGRGAIAASMTTGGAAVASIVSGLAELDWRVGVAIVVAAVVAAIAGVLIWRSQRD